jgi:hypothetical protein
LRLLPLVALCLAAGGAALAHSYRFGDIAVGHVWAPPAAGGEAVVYGPLLNRGAQAERLVAAEAAIAARVEIRFGDEPEPRDFILLTPNKPLSLAPWGYHLKLIGLSEALAEGEDFALTLHFAHAGTHQVRVLVERAPGH